MYKQDVVEHFGTQNAVAEALGIKPPSVSEWGEIVPEKQAFRLERITKRKLKYRPELYRPSAA